jgi:hypothetical protein
MRKLLFQKKFNIILAIVIALFLGYWIGENFPNFSISVPPSQISQGFAQN